MATSAVGFGSEGGREEGAAARKRKRKQSTSRSEHDDAKGTGERAKAGGAPWSTLSDSVHRSATAAASIAPHCSPPCGVGFLKGFGQPPEVPPSPGCYHREISIEAAGACDGEGGDAGEGSDPRSARAVKPSCSALCASPLFLSRVPPLVVCTACRRSACVVPPRGQSGAEGSAEWRSERAAEGCSTIVAVAHSIAPSSPCVLRTRLRPQLRAAQPAE